MRFLGTGSAAPSTVLTNDMLATMVDTTDEWIRSRTGIAERRIAKDETTLDLALAAAKQAGEAAAAADASFSLERLDLVICATVSNEKRCPSLACSLQRELGLRKDILAFDLNAACSGFVYGLIVASRFVTTGSYALVIGTEVLSRLTDFTDRNTCVLFGDGAGAAIVAPGSPGQAARATQTAQEAQATQEAQAAPAVQATQAVQATPEDDFFWVAEASGNSEVLSITNTIHMDGQEVFKFAVDALARTVTNVTHKAGLSLDDVDLFICHQANERIIKSAAKRLNQPLERFFMNLAQYGNTSAASIPLALDEAVRSGAIRPGSRVVMSGFGGGLTAGAVCFTWN